MRKTVCTVGMLCILITGCSSAITLDEQPSGVWRNDSEKIDYHFGPNDFLEVIGEQGSLHELECTFSVENRDLKTRTINVWFKCPQSDWPGYAELHEFIFSEDHKSFTDTMYFQGISSRRYDGKFIRATP